MTTTTRLSTYHLLGRTGLRVSPLALGAMTFGNDDLTWGAGKDTARAILHRYVEAGGNLDAANAYGNSEELLGEFLAETGWRDQLVLATKFTGARRPGDPNAAGNGRKNILASLDASLRRLRTDYIDLYWLHVWDRLTPAEEVMSTLDALGRGGKARAIGLSDVPAWYATTAQLLARAHGWEPVAALQLPYSLVERSAPHTDTAGSVRVAKETTLAGVGALALLGLGSDTAPGVAVLAVAFAAMTAVDELVSVPVVAFATRTRVLERYRRHWDVRLQPPPRRRPKCGHLGLVVTRADVLDIARTTPRGVHDLHRRGPRGCLHRPDVHHRHSLDTPA